LNIHKVRPINPISNILTIKPLSGFSLNDGISVFDSIGIINKNKLISQASNDLHFDFSEFTAGLYLIKIRSRDKVMNELVSKL